MDQVTDNKTVSFIWAIADDVLRDVFAHGKHHDVILPICVFRRLDAVLEPAKSAVLATKTIGVKLAGDVETFERNLGTVVQQTLSYHDLGGDQPEKVYQAFVLGLLISLNATHEVTSNRESGYGRCDVLVCPRLVGQPGVVLELKVVDKKKRETVKSALDSALVQIRERDYAAGLRARGAEPVRELAAVFDGKRVWVRVAEVLDGQGQ